MRLLTVFVLLFFQKQRCWHAAVNCGQREALVPEVAGVWDWNTRPGCGIVSPTRLQKKSQDTINPFIPLIELGKKGQLNSCIHSLLDTALLLCYSNYPPSGLSCSLKTIRLQIISVVQLHTIQPCTDAASFSKSDFKTHAFPLSRLTPVSRATFQWFQLCFALLPKTEHFCFFVFLKKRVTDNILQLCWKNPNYLVSNRLMPRTQKLKLASYNLWLAKLEAVCQKLRTFPEFC